MIKKDQLSPGQRLADIQSYEFAINRTYKQKGIQSVFRYLERIVKQKQRIEFGKYYLGRSNPLRPEDKEMVEEWLEIQKQGLGLWQLTPEQEESVKTFADDIQSGKFGKTDPNNFNPGED